MREKRRFYRLFLAFCGLRFLPDSRAALCGFAAVETRARRGVPALTISKRSAPAIGGSWTFTNHQPEGQSYPQAVPTENYGGLGNYYATYVYRGLGPLGDGASWTSAHTASTFSVTFGGPTNQTDEWWGIDNVQVSVTTIPEPSAALLLIAGLGALGMAARRRFGSAV